VMTEAWGGVRDVMRVERVERRRVLDEGVVMGGKVEFVRMLWRMMAGVRMCLGMARCWVGSCRRARKTGICGCACVICSRVGVSRHEMVER
jgi:hypothetical protein